MMTFVWIVVAFVSIYCVAVVAGGLFLRIVAFLAAVFTTPVKESIRLRKEGNLRRSRWLLWSFVFAVVMLTFLVVLLIAMPK